MTYIKPPCILIGEKVLPVVRQTVAKILVNERGYSQKRTAELLGVTQAMISKYLSGTKKLADSYIQDEIDRISRELSDVLESPGEATRTLCTFCLSLRENAKLCALHQETTGDINCRACMNLHSTYNPRNAVLHILEQAVDLLIKENITSLIPEVRTNFAMSARDPKGPFDVASIPGRLLVVRGHLRSPTAPEFDASKHTTNLLLSINSIQPEICSLMNIRYSEKILSACERQGYEAKLLERKGDTLILGNISATCDYMIDKGAFGIEPCIYLVGKDALGVANKALCINRSLQKVERK